MLVNEKEYRIEKLLGKGKSGFSYLVEDINNNRYVLKKIHHEPCDYYSFFDKFKSEIDDYNFLIKIINVPKLLTIDYENEILIKEYIEGNTIAEMIKLNIDISKYIIEMKNIADICYKHNINIDYYPTNFIPYKEKLFYIDYEKNTYDEKWNFENWGINYWINKEI